jgi:hypothetical protein
VGKVAITRLVYFLSSTVCSGMNPIETEWHQLKSHEIAGQMFDNEHDLAKAVINGIESCGTAGEYSVGRFIFNCV